MPVVNIPGVGRVNFPGNMPLEDIEAAVQELAKDVGRDPNTGKYDPTLSAIDAAMSAPLPNTAEASRYTVSLGPLGKFRVGGVLADAANAMNNVDDKTSVPLALATAGSIAFPPAAAGGLLARFAPGILASGVGGGVGSALVESHQPGATPRSITREGLKGGAQMALAQAAGLGLGAVASKAVAPNLRYADPFKPYRAQITETARRWSQPMRDVLGRFTKPGNAGALSTTLRRAGNFARSPLGGELIEAAAVPAAAAIGGIGLAAPLYAARLMFAPGIAQRWLSNSTLPGLGTRLAGREATTTAIRGGLLAEDANQ